MPADQEITRPPEGKVYLVGGGPGAHDLLTLKGKRCLEEADVVIYDYLADRSLLNYAPASAERIYAGKQAGAKALTQEEIQDLMVRRARLGRIVVRLKGGDPFIFGRGGEEGEHLRRHGIVFEVVPGVTAAIAAPAYAGIPLTHRDYSSNVAFIAGHEDWEVESSLSWEPLARGAHTLVFLMGMTNLAENMRKLIQSGCDPQRPVALVRWGTKGSQQTLVGTVQTIADLARAKAFKPPAVAVVGEVVNLRQTLNWFETKPLFGRRIVITRPRLQAAAFAARIEALGGEVVEFPTIEIRPPQSYEPLDRAIASAGSYQWLIFTSANGVRTFLERWRHMAKDIRDLKGVEIAAIGPETAREVERHDLRVKLVPEEYRAEGLLNHFKPEDVAGKRVLLPRAAEARDVLPEGLERWGAQVEVVEAYRTVPADTDGAWLREMALRGEIDMVTFASSSTVRSFAAFFPPQQLEEMMARVAVACIGPITRATAEEIGLRVQVMPRAYTIAGLTAAILEYYSANGAADRPEAGGYSRKRRGS
jgi:uroporphyrinogen III methyltransferase/synthase